MTQAKAIIQVKASTTLADILREFRSAIDDVVFVDENCVLSVPHLELLTDYPRSASAALVGKSEENADVLVRGEKVVSGVSLTHRATVTNRQFAGAVRLSQIQREEILTALENAIAKPANGQVLNLLLIALVRATIQVDAVEVKGAPFARSEDPKVLESAKKELAKVSNERIRLRIANRANDGFYSVFVLRRLSKILTFIAVKLKVTPNQVTLISFLIGALSAYLFSTASFWWMLLAAALLQLSLIVDCVDGELARYTRKFSKLGAWLDAITDRVKEYAVFLGLAYGTITVQGQNLWLIAMAMMSLQTFRHLSDYNFSQVIKARAREIVPVKVDYLAASDGVEPNGKEPGGRFRYWLRKVVLFPIGERWLVISLTAAIGGAALTFTVMPVLALISLAVVYRVRIIRSFSMPKQRIESRVIATQLDLPPQKNSFTKRFDWSEPSLLRAIELAIMIAVFGFTGNLSIAAYVVLFSTTFHHYDNLYRAMQVEQKPGWLKSISLSIWGRILVVVIFCFANLALEFLAAFFFAVMVLVSSLQWVLSHRN